LKWKYLSEKWCILIVTSLPQIKLQWKYILSYWIFSNLVVWAVIMRQFDILRKMGIFVKNRNYKWEFLPKKWSRLIVTSFITIYRAVKVYFVSLDVFKISGLGFNYDSIWNFEKKYNFLKKIEIWNGNIFRKVEVESFWLSLPETKL